MPLTIVQPAPNTRFNIDATPRMPTITCQARITGLQPDPTPNTLFNWSIQITEAVRASSCPSSRVGNCRLVTEQQNVRGGIWTPTFNTIQGGDAIISVTVIQGNTRLSASVNVQIRGTNPTATTITQRVGGPGTAGDQIACRESGRRQFDGTGMPLLGPGGDVGVMQLCSPAATCLQRWDWTANVAAGLALLGNKEAAARRHLNQHTLNGHYPNNQGLDDAGVLLRETLQRYNGGAYWRWNATTHQWESAPPNQYVAHVLACR